MTINPEDRPERPRRFDDDVRASRRVRHEDEDDDMVAPSGQNGNRKLLVIIGASVLLSLAAVWLLFGGMFTKSENYKIDIGNIVKDIGGLTDSIKKVQSDITSVKSSLAGINTLSNQLSQTNDKISAVEQKITSVQSGMAGYAKSDSLSQLSTNIASIQSSVNDMKATVASLKTTVDGRTADLDAIEKQLVALDTRIVALESRTSSSGGGSSSGEGVYLELNDIMPSSYDVYIDNTTKIAQLVVYSTLYNDTGDDLRDLKMRVTFEFNHCPAIDRTTTKPVATNGWEIYDTAEDMIVLQKRGISIRDNTDRDHDFTLTIHFLGDNDVDASFDVEAEVVSYHID